MSHTPHTWVAGETITVALLQALEDDLASAATASLLPAQYDVRLTVLAPLTSDATASFDSFHPVDATAAPITIGLPAGATKGQVVVVEKEDATANTVTVSGTLRGTAGSVALVSQYESITLTADGAGSWWIRAGHKTKAYLDATYLRAADAASPATTTGTAIKAAVDAEGTAKGWTAITVDGAAKATLDVSSTDLRGVPNGIATLGSDGKLTPAQAPASAAASDPDAWLGYATTVLFPQSANGTLTAGRTWFVRVGRGKQAGATKVGLYLGTTSGGSIMVGVYRPTGSGVTATPGTLVSSSGAPQTLSSLGMTSAGYYEMFLGTSVDVAEGDYLALWGSDGTMAFGFSGMATAMAGNTAQCAYSDSVGTSGTALPTTPSALNGHSRQFYLVAK